GVAAKGPQGLGRLDDVLATADDFRRSAPAGRPFHRADDAEERCRTRPGRPPAAPRGTGSGIRRRQSVMTAPVAEPPRNCALCPRLHNFIALWREREPDWFNAPVPTFSASQGDGTVRLLIVGLAP